MTKEKSRTSPWRRRLVIGALLATTPAAGWLSFDACSRRGLDRALENLAQLSAELAEPSAPQEPSGPDARALEIDVLARRLGYSLRMDTAAPPVVHVRPLEERFHRSRGPAWLRSELARSQHQPIEPVGVTPQDWIERNADAIDALTTSLLAEPAPRWRGLLPDLDIAASYPSGGGPVGHHWTGRILTTAALDAAVAGRHAVAERRLLAAWRLSDSLMEEPGLLVWLVADSLRSEQVAVLRKLSVNGPEWPQRVLEAQAVDPMLLRMTSEAMFFGPQTLEGDYWRRSDLHGPPGGALAWLADSAPGLLVGLDRLTLPFRRRALTGYLSGTAEAVRLLRGCLPCCSDLKARADELEAKYPMPTWIGEWQYYRIAWRAASTTLQADLTSAVLEGRAEGFVDGRRIDATCPERGWQVHATADGLAALTLEGPAPPWEPTSRRALDYSQSSGR